MIVVERWDKRRLAYEIADKREGQYILMYFSGEAKVASELNRLMRIGEDVIRHIIVRAEPGQSDAAKERVSRPRSEPVETPAEAPAAEEAPVEEEAEEEATAETAEVEPPEETKSEAEVETKAEPEGRAEPEASEEAQAEAEAEVAPAEDETAE